VQPFAFREPDPVRVVSRKHFACNSLDFSSFGLEHAAQRKDNLSSLAWLMAGGGRGETVKEPNLLGDLEFIDASIMGNRPGPTPDRLEARCEATKPTDPLAAQGAGGTSADLPADSVPNETVEETRLSKVLEEAQLATGATGVAIALVRGAEMVCCATTGPNAPDLWTCLDPGTGLSGRCLQTRELQQCSDTETDPHVDLEACQRLGVRSMVVLPLMDSDELFGVFEIFSSRPHAFGQRDLDSLQTLTDRILESKLPQWKDNATAPRRDHAVDPLQAELLAREVFRASAQSESGVRHSNHWMAIRTAAVVALAVLLGWMVGNAGWKMAVDRAESQPSRSQQEVPPPVQVAPGPLLASLPVEQPTLAHSETTSFSESTAGTLQTAGIRDSDFAVAPAQISPKATNSYVLVEVKPGYPEEAQRHHIQGRVVMKVLVGINGLVRDIVVTSGDPQLVKSAANAVRQWRFRPHSLKGQPVEFETQVTVNFALT
jgi:TonB family protein